jgi:hypothetical protein
MVALMHGMVDPKQKRLLDLSQTALDERGALSVE